MPTINAITHYQIKDWRTKMSALQKLEKAVLDEVCPAGEAWMCEVKKGQYFRIVDLEGNQAVDTYLSAQKIQMNDTVPQTH